MRRTAGPTGPPPAKTRGVPRVGATGASGATERTAGASAAAAEFCSAEARRRRGPDCCPPTEPNPNPRTGGEATQQDAWTTAGRGQRDVISTYLCEPWAAPLLPWLSYCRCLASEDWAFSLIMLIYPPTPDSFWSSGSPGFLALKWEQSGKESPFNGNK